MTKVPKSARPETHRRARGRIHCAADRRSRSAAADPRQPVPSRGRDRASFQRLYDAIESGIADLNDPALKERLAALRRYAHQAQVDPERAQAVLESSGSMAVDASRSTQVRRNRAAAAQAGRRLSAGSPPRFCPARRGRRRPVSHQHILGLAWQVDHHRLADADRQHLRASRRARIDGGGRIGSVRRQHGASERQRGEESMNAARLWAGR